METKILQGELRGEVYDYITAKLGYSVVELVPDDGSGGRQRAHEIMERRYAEAGELLPKARSESQREGFLRSIYLHMKKELLENLSDTYVREIEKFAHGDGKAAVRRLAAMLKLGGGTVRFYQHGEANSKGIIDTWNRLHPDDTLEYIPAFYDAF